MSQSRNAIKLQLGVRLVENASGRGTGLRRTRKVELETDIGGRKKNDWKNIEYWKRVFKFLSKSCSKVATQASASSIFYNAVCQDA